MPALHPLVAATFLAATLATAADAGDVDVVVQNVRTDRGAVLVQLCDRTHFLGQCTLGGQAPARKGAVVVVFHNVPPGDYAVMAFHDRNGNGRLDRWLAIPKEDFGFSRMSGLPLRPPRFKDAEFTHGTSDQKLSVKLNNYFG